MIVVAEDDVLTSAHAGCVDAANGLHRIFRITMDGQDLYVDSWWMKKSWMKEKDLQTQTR